MNKCLADVGLATAQTLNVTSVHRTQTANAVVITIKATNILNIFIG